MGRCICAVVALLVAAAAAGGGADPTPRVEPPPNVVLITLDTTRADRLGCYGSPSATTPNLDRLAASGVRFDQVQSPAPLTVPAHASMMTGRVPRRHGVRSNNQGLPAADVPLLAEILAGRGYDTAAFVSSFVLDRQAGLARGFRIYDDRVRVGSRAAFNYEERAASQTNDALFRRLGELEPPFFLWVHYFDPHLPYVAPPPFDERFGAYDGEVAFMDAAIGRLLERLRGHAPHSLIVVAGDHGESLGEHGEPSHGVFLYQSTQRVPWIVAGPGVPHDRTVPERVGLVDLLPTVLDLLGVDAQPEIDGRSIVPLMRGGKRAQPVAYEMESWFPRLAYDWAPLRAVVRGDLALIDAPRPELYDLATDPRQTKELWDARSEGPELLSALRRRTAGDALVPTAPDEETAERRRRLSALGYVGGSPQRDSTASIDPKDGMALLQLLDQARLALRDGHSERAVELLGSLLEKNPGNLQARLTLVAAELRAGRAAAAVATARVALAANPDDDLVRFNLANALLAESRERPAALDEAREQYEHTLRLNPRRADVYLNYASLLVSAGETTEARRLLVRSETAGIEDPDLATERALLELMLGNREAAIRYLEQAVALDPGAADALRALARLRGGPSATPKSR